MTSIGLAIAAATVVATLEHLSPESERRPTSRRHALRAGGWFAGTLTVSFVAGWIVGGLLQRLDRFSPVAVPGPRVLRFVVALVLVDLSAYWLHRAMHVNAVLWRLHRVHHASDRVRWWTTYRWHPVDLLLSVSVPYGIAAAAGVGVDAIGLVAAATSVVTWFAHADVLVPGGRVLDVVVLPASHRTHHEIGHDRTNFAVVLPVWDHMFGTHARWAGSPRRFGVSQTSASRSTATPGLPAPMR